MCRETLQAILTSTPHKENLEMEFKLPNCKPTATRVKDFSYDGNFSKQISDQRKCVTNVECIQMCDIKSTQKKADVSLNVSILTFLPLNSC